MLNFATPRFRRVGSRESHREVTDVAPVELLSVDVTCDCGNTWTARPGDGWTVRSLGGLRVECPRCKQHQPYVPPAS